MEKLRNITKVKNNLKSTIREINPVLKSYQKDKNTFDVASNCGQTLPNFWYNLNTEEKINWLKNQEIKPSSEDEYNWSILSPEESEEAKKSWVDSQEENFNRGCQATNTSDVKHKIGWEQSKNLTQDRLKDTQKILNDKLGYVSSDINDWDSATVNTSSSLLQKDNLTFCYQCPTQASTDLEDVDSSNACKQIPCPINSSSSNSSISSGGGSNKNKRGWWLPGKKIEHFTSDCQINANLEANKDTDFFFFS